MHLPGERHPQGTPCHIDEGRKRVLDSNLGRSRNSQGRTGPDNQGKRQRYPFPLRKRPLVHVLRQEGQRVDRNPLQRPEPLAEQQGPHTHILSEHIQERPLRQIRPRHMPGHLRKPLDRNRGRRVQLPEYAERPDEVVSCEEQPWRTREHPGSGEQGTGGISRHARGRPDGVRHIRGKDSQDDTGADGQPVCG